MNNSEGNLRPVYTCGVCNGDNPNCLSCSWERKQISKGLDRLAEISYTVEDLKRLEVLNGCL